MPVWGDYAGSVAAEALASLRAQDVPARIVVVDNASEPPLEPLEGAEVLRSPTRLTVGAARNLGLEAVSTQYVVFWDADDLMLPGTLRHLQERIAGDERIVAVAAAIMEGDPPVPHRWPRRWTYRLTRWPHLFAYGHCVWSLFPSTGSTIMRADAVRAAGGYADSNSGEDWVLGVSLAFRGRVVLDSRPGRIYRRHAESLWETQRSLGQLRRNARNVRVRIRRDPRLRPARRVLPLIAVLQGLANCILHPLAELVRSARPGGRSVSER